jgi:hypothetical protein
MEVRQNKRLIEHKARAIDQFKEVRPYFTKIEEETFLANAIANLEARMQHLKEQVEHIKQTFSDFLALRNMRAIYTLQWVVIVLSVLAIITGVFDVMGNWSGIKQFLKDVLGIMVLYSRRSRSTERSIKSGV